MRRARPRAGRGGGGAAVEHLGGLDVVIANAGVAAQLPLLGGDPEVFERTIEVNLLGRLLHAPRRRAAHRAPGRLRAGDRLARRRGPPAAARRLQRVEGGRRGARRRAADRAGGRGRASGVAYFGELETDMTRRGFGTEAAAAITRGPFSTSRRCGTASTRSSGESSAAPGGSSRRGGSRRCCRSGWWPSGSSISSPAAGSTECSRSLATRTRR